MGARSHERIVRIDRLGIELHHPHADIVPDADIGGTPIEVVAVASRQQDVGPFTGRFQREGSRDRG